MESTESQKQKPPSSAGTILLFAGIVVHLLFLLSLRFGYINPFFDDSTHRIGQGADFYAVYQAGQNVSDGVSIYAQAPQNLIVPYAYPYRYLPFSAYTLGQVFRLLRPPQAYVFWIVVQEILLALNVTLTSRLFSDPARTRTAAALWLIFSPYYLELYMGQFSFLMASLIFWMLVAWSRRRELMGNVSWILSLLAKTNTVLFVPVLLKTRRWKLLILAAVVVGAASLPYFVLVPGSWDAFAWNFTEGLSAETIAGNQGFAALLATCILRTGGLWIQNVAQFLWNLGVLNEALQTPLMLWTVLVFGSAVFLTIRSSRAYAMELMILWLLAYFLTYKHVWEHQYVMLLPVFVLIYWMFAGRGNAPVVPKALFWCTYWIIALPTPFGLIDSGPGPIDPEFSWNAAQSLAFHSGKPLAVLALYCGVGAWLWKHGGRAASPDDAAVV